MTFEFTPKLKAAIRTATERLNAAATAADKTLREVSDWLAENGPKVRVEGKKFADVADPQADGGVEYTLTYDRIGKDWCLGADVYEYRYDHDEDGARIMVDEHGFASEGEVITLQERKQAALTLPRELRIAAVTVLDDLLKGIAEKADELSTRVESAVLPNGERCETLPDDELTPEECELVEGAVTTQLVNEAIVRACRRLDGKERTGQIDPEQAEHYRAEFAVGRSAEAMVRTALEVESACDAAERGGKPLPPEDVTKVFDSVTAFVRGVKESKPRRTDKKGPKGRANPKK